MADTPDDYWCRIPELLDLPLEQRKSLSIPKELVSNCSHTSAEAKAIKSAH